MNRSLLGGGYIEVMLVLVKKSLAREGHDEMMNHSLCCTLEGRDELGGTLSLFLSLSLSLSLSLFLSLSLSRVTRPEDVSLARLHIVVQHPDTTIVSALQSNLPCSRRGC